MTWDAKGMSDDKHPGVAGKRRDRVAPWRARRRQFGLRHIMGLSVVIGLVFAAVAQAEKTGKPSDAILAALAVATAFMAFGLFIALRLERWNVIGWIIVVLTPTILAIGTTAASGGGTPFFVAFLLVPVLIGTLVHVTRRLRAAQQETMLWVLALTAERDRPLGSAVMALSEQSAGRNRVRLRRVAECLEFGLTLPEALDFVRKSAPASARVLVRLGHDSGALPEALRDAAASRSKNPPGWQTFGAKVAYLCLLLAVMQAIVGFVLYFIMPKFEAIFKDFGIDLPWMTVAVVRWSQWLTGGYLFPILTVLEWLLLLYLPFAFAGYAELKVPFFDRLFLRRHSVMILRGLAMVVEAGRPIGSGLKTLADSYPATWVRERLAGVYLAAEEGHDWIDALQRFGLINRTDLALLESARRAGNLPWALRELADSSARRLQYRLQVIGQVGLTLALLALGVFVGFIAVAYFYPLVQLIERLTG